jgi:hypothetical protein
MVPLIVALRIASAGRINRTFDETRVEAANDASFSCGAESIRSSHGSIGVLFERDVSKLDGGVLTAQTDSAFLT